MKSIKVLVLGADGMVGRSVYNYLKIQHSKNLSGTSRTAKNLLKFDATQTNELKKLLEKADYIINCIGINKITSKNKLQAYRINSQFPKLLDRLTTEFNFKLIHISSDAVYDYKSGKVIEIDTPNPKDLYGKSKLKGEVNGKNSITIRTSIIGYSPIKKTGLLEFVLNSQGQIEGYENNLWSGCTTLQFSKFCEYLIFKNKFSLLRRRSNVFHFCPLGPVSKYEVIKTFIKVSKKRIKLKKVNSSKPINRFLASYYFDKNFFKTYTTDITKALKELSIFEASINIK